MLFTSETSLTARIAARGQEWPALKLPDILRCAKITRRDYIEYNFKVLADDITTD